MNGEGDTARVIEALRRRGGRATAGDIAADTGLPLQDVERHLRALIERYESHLDVEDDGTLWYRFEPSLRQRVTPESAAERDARRRLASARLTRQLMGGLGVFVLLFYGWVYGAVTLVVGLALLGGTGRLKPWIADTSLGYRNRARVARGKSPVRSQWARPWDRGERAYPVAKPLGESLRAGVERVRRLVGGPLPADPPYEQRLATLTHAVRTLGGVISVPEALAVLGTTLPEAEQALADLLIRHEGHIALTEDRSVLYRFDALAKRTRAADGAGLFVWQRAEIDDGRVVRDGVDAWLLALTVMTLGGAIALQVFLPRWGWGQWWILLPLVWVPITYTAVVLVRLGLRALGGASRSEEMASRRARVVLLSAVVGDRMPLPADGRRIVAQLGRHDIPGEDLVEEAERLVGELGTEPGTDREGDVLLFSDAWRAMDAAADARSRVGGPGPRGQIVFTTS